MKYLRYSIVHILVLGQILIYSETRQFAHEGRLPLRSLRFKWADCLDQFSVIGRFASRFLDFRNPCQLRQVRRLHQPCLRLAVLGIALGLRPQGHRTRLHHVFRAGRHRDLLEKIGHVRLQIRSCFVYDVLRQFVVALEILGTTVHEERGVCR